MRVMLAPFVFHVLMFLEKVTKYSRAQDQQDILCQGRPRPHNAATHIINATVATYPHNTVSVSLLPTSTSLRCHYPTIIL